MSKPTRDTRKKDGKGRLFLPITLREKFLQKQIKTLVCISIGDHLIYCTPEQWEQSQDLLVSGVSDAKERQRIKDSLLTVKYQKAGRVVLPKQSKLAHPSVKKLIVESYDNFFKVFPVEKKAPLGQFVMPFVSLEKTREPVIKDALPAPKAGKGKTHKAELPLVWVRIKDIRQDDQTFLNRLTLNVADLQVSIRDHGQQVPVILRGKKPYQIVSGYRRITAIANLEGHDEVLAVVHPDLKDKRAFAISLIENLQRHSLSDYEKIRALALMREQGYTTIELGRLIGKGKRIVEQYLQVWRGPDSIKEALRNQDISISAAISAVSRNLEVQEVQGRPIRELTLISSKEITPQVKGPIYFREFDNGRISLRMQYDRKRDDLTTVIDKLDKILETLKKRRNEMTDEQQQKEA